MSLLSYNKLLGLVQNGVITANPENVNGASIDITLGDVLLKEKSVSVFEYAEVDLAKKENIGLEEHSIKDFDYILKPGEFILAQSNEIFNLPDTIAAEYKLKSSMARNGLNHMLAGWCDPTWNGSVLTLELQNVTANHHLRLSAGMKIGQVVFWETDPVPAEHGYATKGQYNGDKSVQGSKGIK